MATQSREQVGLVYVRTSTTSYSNTSAEQTLASYSIPANTLQVGSTYRWELHGTTSNIQSGGNLTWRVKLGSVEVYNSTGTGTSASSGVPWTLFGHFTIRAIGSSGTVAGGGYSRYNWGNTAKFDQDGDMSGTVNTTTALTFAITAQMATANAGNVVNAFVGNIELLKL